MANGVNHFLFLFVRIEIKRIVFIDAVAKGDERNPRFVWTHFERLHELFQEILAEYKIFWVDTGRGVDDKREVYGVVSAD